MQLQPTGRNQKIIPYIPASGSMHVHNVVKTDLRNKFVHDGRASARRSLLFVMMTNSSATIFIYFSTRHLVKAAVAPHTVLTVCQELKQCVRVLFCFRVGATVPSSLLVLPVVWLRAASHVS
jgi:hypothetical protein